MGAKFPIFIAIDKSLVKWAPVLNSFRITAHNPLWKCLLIAFGGDSYEMLLAMMVCTSLLLISSALTASGTPFINSLRPSDVHMRQKLTIIGSDNGLSPGRRQAIIWINAGILLKGPLRANVSEMLIEMHTFLFTKMHVKMSSAKWRPFYLGLNMLTTSKRDYIRISIALIAFYGM